MAQSHSPLSVGMVCLHAYPLFNETVRTGIGGMETRAALFARSLVKNGLPVKLFVGEYRQKYREMREGVELRKYQPLWTLLSVDVPPRFVKHRWRPVINGVRSEAHLLWRIPCYLLFRVLPLLRSIVWWRNEVDVLLCFGNNEISAEAIADCRRIGIPTILMLASDGDLSEDYTATSTQLNAFGVPHSSCWETLQSATLIVAQTRDQQRLLQSRFGRSSCLVPNPVATQPAATETVRDHVLWIGRSEGENKRPQLCIELARRCPHIRFVMIVNLYDANLHHQLENELPDNVKLIPQVPPTEIWAYLRTARMLVNTSRYEGFPNTVLQAGMTCTPVVSLSVDPDGLFSEKNAGLLAEDDLDRLEQHVRRLWESPELAQALGKKLQEEIQSTHDIETSTATLMAAIGSALSAGRQQVSPGLAESSSPLNAHDATDR